MENFNYDKTIFEEKCCIILIILNNTKVLNNETLQPKFGFVVVFSFFH